jgi:hypothetical protein
LTRLESQVFNGLDFAIIIPSTVLFVASDIISNFSHIFISDRDFYPEFDRWKQLRQSGISIDFRRILRVGSGLINLSDYQIDLAVFEEELKTTGLGLNLSGKYQRLADGSMFVVQSTHRLKSVGSCTLENMLNLRHPCIAGPIGFVVQIESDSQEELKIVGLSVEGDSLSEVISANPMWWTATEKAKAVAGIVVGLQFVHSLGLTHGHLNSNNIIFDSEHRIEIGGFCPITEEIGESEKNVDVRGFSSKVWLPETDISGFRSILFEILTGSDVPAFVSEMVTANQSFHDILNVLKDNQFALMSGVDSEAVSSFVEWVESTIQ